MTDQRAYYRAEDGDWCEYYDMLKGPDDFECLLTEPEDRNWWRDGREVVTRLNEQHDEIASLTARLAASEVAFREILDRAEDDDVVSCIAIASKAIGLRMFVGNPPNSADEAAKGLG